MMALDLDPLSSEHGVLGSAGKASVFAKKASSVRSRCLHAGGGLRCSIQLSFLQPATLITRVKSYSNAVDVERVDP
jgi:hypothetical protein